jgi:hypothetical protein
VGELREPLKPGQDGWFFRMARQWRTLESLVRLGLAERVYSGASTRGYKAVTTIPHQEGCAEARARTCTTPVECKHGFDVCPECDPCKCDEPKPKPWGPDAPMAIAGLVSYRYRGHFGWVMIGARDDGDALVQAQRSIRETPVLANLQIWSGTEYVNVREGSTAAPV